MKKYESACRKMSVSFMAFLIAGVLTLLAPMTASAESASTYTYTPAVNEGWVRTQDAYQVTEVILQEVALNLAQDIIVRDDILYIADTGSGKIVLYNLKTAEVKEWGVGSLTSPSGLFLTEDKELYVADNEAGKIVVFDENGEADRSYEKPKTVTFGSDAVFRPSKIVVNANDTMYVVSDGAFDGIIQMDQQGEFLGYFGYNNNPMTAWDYVVDFVFTDEMKEQLTNRVPYSFKSVTIDEKGMLYTVTQSAEGNALKKHDGAGHNLLSTDMMDEQDFVDVCLGLDKRIYAVTSTGLLFEYDVNGELLFTFGGRAISTERNGVFTTVSAVTCDETGRLYVLDAERGLVHIMKPTDYAESYHEALNLYDKGDYAGSIELWKHINAVGGTNYYVENSLGQCLFEKGDFKQAAEHYKLAGNRDGYSDAYWQIRNEQLGDILPYVAAVLVVFFVGRFIYKRLRKPTEKAVKQNIIRDDVKLIFKTIRHPIDSFYAIRREGAGHIATSFALYVIEYLLFLGYFLGSGFVLIGNSAEDASVLFLSAMFWGPVLLFVISNFLVCEVGEGEARFRDVFISTSYVLAPFTVLMPFIIPISHILTGNELRIMHLVLIAMIGWMFIYLLIATMQIHNYEMSDTIRHLLITLFLMCVIVLALSLLYMLFDQMLNMIISIIKEVNYRVFLS